MSKTHVTSIAYGQNVSENLTKWQKNISKHKNNAKKRQKWQKMIENTIKTGKKRQKDIRNHQTMAKIHLKT